MPEHTCLLRETRQECLHNLYLCLCIESISCVTRLWDRMVFWLGCAMFRG